jgi:hypothetical protein
VKDVKNVFRTLEKKLRQARWFDNEWDIYNRGTYLQLYKDSWHNGNQGGVHFETFIEAPQLKVKAFPVCLHAEEDCPAQARFIQRLLDLEGERIQGWKGYEIIGDGYAICQRTLPLNFKNLEDRLIEELNRLRQLETTIDQILHTL